MVAKLRSLPPFLNGSLKKKAEKNLLSQVKMLSMLLLSPKGMRKCKSPMFPKITIQSS